MTTKIDEILGQIREADSPQEKNRIGAEVLKTPGLEDEMIAYVSDKNAFISQLAVRYVIQSPDQQKNIESLIGRALYSTDDASRHTIVNTLRRFPSESVQAAADTVGEFVIDVSTRAELVFMMSDLNLNVSDEILLILTEALSSDDQLLIQRCTEMLADIGEDAAELLLPMLGQEDPLLQQNATNAMIAIGKPAVPFLVAGLGKANQLSQQNAYRALSEIGEDAHDAVYKATSSTNAILQSNADRWMAERTSKFKIGSWFKR